MRVGPQHWALWARECRDTGSHHLGYPSQTPHYTPARRSEGFGEAPITDEDMAIADLVGVAVKKANESERMALVEFYGARPGASSEKEVRIAVLKRKLNRNKTAVYGFVTTARRGVERYVEARLEGA